MNGRKVRGRNRPGEPLEREDLAPQDLPPPPAGRMWTEKPDSYVVHKHAAWVCLAATFVAGTMTSACAFLLGMLVG